MTSEELHQQRRGKWHVNSAAVRTLPDAQSFLDDVGLCLLYAARPAVLLPTLVGATLGDDANLPVAKKALVDERARPAEVLARRLIQEKAAFASNLFPDNWLLISARAFPYLYALVGERGGKQERTSPLAQLSWSALQKAGPLTETDLREQLGAEPSITAVERALGEVWMRLRVVPIGDNAAGERQWDTLQHWSPETARAAANISQPAAISALVSQFLEAVVAAEQAEIEEFLSHVAPRSKVREAVHALLAAREFSFVSVGHRTLVQLTPARVPYVPKPRPPVAAKPARTAAPPRRDFARRRDSRRGRPTGGKRS